MGEWKGKSAWSIADNFAQQALSFIIFALLARWLTPHAFGLLAIAHLMVLFARMSILDALAMPVVRAQSASNALFDWLFTLCSVAALLLAAVMALLSPLLASFFRAPELLPVLLGMSLAIVLNGLVCAHEARLLREGNFRLLAIRSIVSVSCGGALALYLALRGAGAMALVAQQLATGLIALLIAIVAEWRIWRPHWRWSNTLIRTHAREMQKVSTSALLNYANNNGDAVLVSVLFGPTATGLYNLVKRVLSAAYLIIGASLGRVGISLFVQQQSDPALLRRSYARMLGMTLLLLVPVYALVTALAEPMVVIVFGEQWRPSAPLFGWLSVIYLTQAIFALGQNLSFATGQSARVPKLALTQLLIAVACALVFMRWFGVTGIAAGFAIGSLLGMLAMQRAIARQLDFSLRSMLLMVLPMGVGAIIGTAFLRILVPTGLQITGWFSLFFAGASGLLAYALSAALVGRFVNRS